jgi:O-antigen/teichoic acid export membrane protein
MQNRNNHTIQTFWVGLGSLSAFALSIISAAILSRYFDKAEYGTYRQILYVYNTLLVVFSAGLPKVFSYFLPRFSLAQGKDIVWKISRILIVAGFAFSFFLFAFSGIIANLLRNPELAIGLKVFSPIPMLLLPTLGIEGIFSTYRKTFFIALYNIITRILMLLFIVSPVIIFNGSYLHAIYGWIAVSIISLIVAYYFKGIPFKRIDKVNANLTVKQVLEYSIPLVIASIAGIAITSADQFFISRYFGAEVFAIFANGFVELPFVHMISASTAVVLMPVFSKILHEKTNVNVLKDLWKNTLTKSAILVYPILIFCMYYARDLVTLLYSEKYADSSLFFQIAIIRNFFNIIIFAPLILAAGRSKFYANFHILMAIISWVTTYLMVLIFNSAVLIAFWSVTLGIIRTLLAFIYASKIIGIHPLEMFPFKKICVIILHALLILLFVEMAGHYFLNDTLPSVLLMSKGILYGLLLLSTGRVFSLDYMFFIKNINSDKASK